MLVGIVSVASAPAAQPDKLELQVGPAYSQNSDLDTGWQASLKYRFGGHRKWQAVYQHIDGLNLNETYSFRGGHDSAALSRDCKVNLDYAAKADYLGVGTEKIKGRLTGALTVGAARTSERLKISSRHWSESCSDATTRFAWRSELQYKLTDNGWLAGASYTGTGVKNTTIVSGYLGKSW